MGVHNKIAVFALVLLAAAEFGGCSWQTIEEMRSRPTITSNPEWRFEEGCGSERCGGWPVDFLHGKSITIRIESQVYVPPPKFVIRAQFILDKPTLIEIDPSLTHVELSDKESLKAKGYNCYKYASDRYHKIESPPIHSRTTLTGEPGRDCLFFIFDAPAPKVHEVFKLILRGVTLNGNPLEIPVITFRPVLTRY